MSEIKIAYEITSDDLRYSKPFRTLDDMVEYLRENLYENFTVLVYTDYDYHRILEETKKALLVTFAVPNVLSVTVYK